MRLQELKPRSEQGTRRVIYAALIVNLLIAAAKLVAGLLTDSSAMVAEAAHSVADTFSEVFLLIGLRLSALPADDIHPYGYGKDRFFWSFLAAVFTFVAGGLFSVQKGITSLWHPERPGPFLPNYAVLGIAFVFEAASLAISTREFSRIARARDRSFWGHFRATRNTSIKLPLYEDTAALAGIVLAALGLGLAEATGSFVFDGMASVGIGAILLWVAWAIGVESRTLLLGEAVSAEDLERIRQSMTAFPEVRGVPRLLTMHLGPRSVLVNAELDVADGLDPGGIADLLKRITAAIRRQVPEVSHTFLELHSGGLRTSRTDRDAEEAPDVRP